MKFFPIVEPGSVLSQWWAQLSLYFNNVWMLNGNIGIGTQSPHSPLSIAGLQIFANNAAAIAGGLTAGDLYRTGADPDPVCIVH